MCQSVERTKKAADGNVSCSQNSMRIAAVCVWSLCVFVAPLIPIQHTAIGIGYQRLLFHSPSLSLFLSSDREMCFTPSFPLALLSFRVSNETLTHPDATMKCRGRVCNRAHRKHWLQVCIQRMFTGGCTGIRLIEYLSPDNDSFTCLKMEGTGWTTG